MKINKTMKYKFIPVDNDLKKAVAFANTLDNNFIKKTQKTPEKELKIAKARMKEWKK